WCCWRCPRCRSRIRSNNPRRSRPAWQGRPAARVFSSWFLLSCALAPRCFCRDIAQEIAARVHRGVENARTIRRCGGWDSSPVDDGRAIDGVRKVLHAVLADAVGELEGGRLLHGVPHFRWLQVLARADGLSPLIATHTDPKIGKVA